MVNIIAEMSFYKAFAIFFFKEIPLEYFVCMQTMEIPVIVLICGRLLGNSSFSFVHFHIEFSNCVYN